MSRRTPTQTRTLPGEQIAFVAANTALAVGIASFAFSLVANLWSWA